MDILLGESLAVFTFGLSIADSLHVSGFLITVFLMSLLIYNMGTLEAAGAGMLGLFFSTLGLFFFLPVWIVIPIVGLFVLALVAMALLALYVEAKTRFCRRKAIKQLPLAKQSDIENVVELMMFKKFNVLDFRMADEGMVAYGHPASPIYVSKFKPWKYINRPYAYEKEAKEIKARYPQALLFKDDLHAVCAHLYFNWMVESLVTNDQATTITLVRRGETKTLNFMNVLPVIPAAEDTNLQSM
jgi:hypothetical protein